MAKPGEFELIAKYFAPLSGRGSFGLKDDAAEFVPTPGNSLVITQDAIAEGVHFFPDDRPDLIARKALRVNLSDLAAKGAVAREFSIALGLSKRWTETWVAEFAQGLTEDCKTYGIDLSGGDTFRTEGGFVISITMIGELETGSYVSRLGAKPGDHVYVTGTIGDAALGLLARRGTALSHINNAGFFEDRYLLPQPRVEFAATVRKFASAAMDISDGLVGDAEKLAQASGCEMNLNAEEIPLSNPASQCIALESDYLQTALTGGDDYEILLTVTEKNLADFEDSVAGLDFCLTRIGRIGTGAGVKVFDKDGAVMEFDRTSYDHSDPKF